MIQNKNYILRAAKLAGKAMHDYDMIQDKDKILVGLSGGKDSFTLLHILSTRRKWIPVDYELHAVYVKMNAPCGVSHSKTDLKKLCEELNVIFHEKVIEIDAPRTSECFWCSWNKRKTLFNSCEEYGCNKLALGHHKDDIVETYLLNLFYHGQIATMPPKLDFFDGKLTMIRPLAYMEETMSGRYAEEHGFIPVSCSKEFFNTTQRSMVKNLIADLKKSIPKVKSNLFNSLRKEIDREYIL